MKKKIAFLATEDWFIRSHFLPLVRRARAEGYDVVVGARDSGALNEEGVRVVHIPFSRRSMTPGALWREASAMRAFMRAERPDLVHAIALRPILMALITPMRGTGRVLALTGRGYLGVSKSWLRWIAPQIGLRIRHAARHDPRTMLLVENEADRAWVERGERLPDARVALMPGAGVDPTRFPAQPEPEGPFVVGAASRLIWSKGLDLLVDAVARLNAAGRDIRLRIAGDADAGNPEAVDAETLARWRATPGVSLLGKLNDVAAFWAGAHVAAFPTRGGEGLPRSLLEAASSARALIVTDTPGCADFVREADAGLIVPAQDAAALAYAIANLADDAARRRLHAENARARVLAAYTETHAADVAAGAWRALLAN